MAIYLKDFRRGDTKTILIRRRKIINGVSTPIDITGNLYVLFMAPDFDSPPTIMLSTTPGDNEMDEPEGGNAYLTIKHLLSKTIPEGKYVYQIQEISKGIGGEPVISTIFPPIEVYNEKVAVLPELAD